MYRTPLVLLALQYDRRQLMHLAILDVIELQVSCEALSEGPQKQDL